MLSHAFRARSTRAFAAVSAHEAWTTFGTKHAASRESNLKKRFRLTPQADQDVIRLYAESISRFGVRQARRYRDDLIQCLMLLASQPQMARLRSEFDPPFRAHFHASHVIAYIEAENGILILRIFHARQDWPQLI